MAYFLLEGGAEFGGRMSEADGRAMELAGGPQSPLVILPTAAAPDQNHLRAGRNGQHWFESLGASRVGVVPVIDQESANDPALAGLVKSAHLIYLLGGFPHYLCETLRDSRVWLAALEAQRSGAVIGGSSAGAMVLCGQYYDPGEKKLLRGLGLLEDICILPHHDRFGRNWASQLRSRIPQVTLLGIDEQTGIINEVSDRVWSVYGAGLITLYRGEQIEVHASGERFRL
ncbi:MAG TPA: Type 1 glutamine amidotransferase-like domain-containing protein [Anaerolineales bacterium]|nr:Type 1 glutamine amidotransferase-like domain-containing protein [Anaerolineales bacterium]